MNPIAKKCKFPQCSRHTRRTNEKCVLHRHYNLQSVLPLNDETEHASNNLYLKKIYEQILIEKTLLQYKKVLYEIKYSDSKLKSLNNEEWELIETN